MSEAACIILDTGFTASQRPEAGRSFLDISKELASLFVERRLFSESKDELCLVLAGSEETSNSMEYDNISVFERGFAPADWDLVTFLRSHVEGTEVEADWLDSVIVAMDLLRTAQEARDAKKKFSALRIFLFSELGVPCSNDKLDVVLQGMAMLDNLEFTFIGPGWKKDDEDDEGGNNDNGDSDPGPSTSKGEPSKAKSRKLYPTKRMSKVQETNGLIVDQLVQQTDGDTCTLDEAQQEMLFKQKKVKKPHPWKVCFSLGPDIKINTTGYVLTRREAPKSWKRCLAKGGEEAELKPETKYVRVVEAEGEEEEEVAQEDIVMGYRYGREIVTISEEDEAGVKFDGGPKSLTLFGFLPLSELKYHQLVGDGSMIFLPTEGDVNSGRAWSTLVQAMLELKVVAVVRKVYSRISAPRLGALVPEYNDDGELTVVWVELPFAEDIRHLEFPSLPAATAEQSQVMDLLVDQMMLCDEEVDGFPVDQILNPSHQHVFESLTQRALHPGQLLPGPSHHILESVSPPEEIFNSAQPLFREMQKIFQTKTREDLKKRNLSETEEEKKESKRMRTDEVTHVGEVTPVTDFRYLLAHSVTSNTSLDQLSLQLETVVMDLLASPFSSDLTRKILACLTAHREESVAHQRPELYNGLVRRLKTALSQKGKQRLWLEVAEANLGLIAHSEVAGGATEAEAHEFLLP